VIIVLLVSLCPAIFFLRYPFYLSGGPSRQRLISSLKCIYGRGALGEYHQNGLRDQKLDDLFLEKIGGSSVGIFPWEISYAAANRLNYRPFPVIQLYDAYTPYLDRLCAEFLDSSKKAPEFILFEWKSIDGRHPLMDTPAVWLVLYKWYDVDQRKDDLLLLKRRNEARSMGVRHNHSVQANVGKYISIPSSEHPVIMELDLELSAVGILRKFFFRIPEVKMQLSDDSQVIGDYRVIPDTLSDGMLINFFPLSLEGVNVLLSDDKIEKNVSRFKIYGEGTRFYKPEISLDFYEISDIIYPSS